MAQRFGQILTPRDLWISRYCQNRAAGVHQQQCTVAEQINLMFARHRIALRQGFKISKQIQRIFGFHPAIGGVGKEIAVIRIAFGRHTAHQSIQKLIVGPPSNARHRIGGDVGGIDLAQPVFKNPPPRQKLHVIFNRMAGRTACRVVNHFAAHRVGCKTVERAAFKQQLLRCNGANSKTADQCHAAPKCYFTIHNSLLITRTGVT